MEILAYVFMLLYVVVFVLSIIKFSEYKNTSLRYLPLILLFTIVTEYTGRFLRDMFLLPNAVVFNIYYLFYFSFFFYVFMKVIPEAKFKKYIKIGFGLFWVVYLRDLVATDIVNDSFTMSYIVGSGILVFCIILYYISILQSSLVLVVKNDLLFWVSVGLFLFYIGYIPIKIIRTWFYKPDSFFEILQAIQFSLIVVMYLFFLAGFLWMKKRS